MSFLIHPVCSTNPKLKTMSLINTPVQAFKTQAFHNGKFIEVSDASLKGKWSVLIFMPAAFTFNCPTEIEDAADNYAAFQKAGAEVYIVTTDTHFSHKVWHETSPAVGKAKFPLVGDPTHKLTRAVGVHIEEDGTQQPTQVKFAPPSGKKALRL